MTCYKYFIPFDTYRNARYWFDTLRIKYKNEERIKFKLVDLSVTFGNTKIYFYRQPESIRAERLLETTYNKVDLVLETYTSKQED